MAFLVVARVLALAFPFPVRVLGETVWCMDAYTLVRQRSWLTGSSGTAMPYDGRRRCWLATLCATPLSLCRQFTFLSFRVSGLLKV